MARHALKPDQQSEVRRRLAAGDGIRLLAREFGVGVATISRLAEHAEQVRNVAEQVAAAQAALASLPIQQQHLALSLADKLRSISDNLASAADLGAKTAHRAAFLANQQMSKVDDADPMKSVDKLRDAGALTKLANEAASPAFNLLAANKPAVERLNADRPPEPTINPALLSPGTLAELLAARDAGSV